MGTHELNRDDVFILGNIAMKSVFQGKTDRVADITRLLRRERPENAAGVMIAALSLLQKGQRSAAIREMEEANIFAAEACREDAIILYLSLLMDDGQTERVAKMAETLLHEGLIEGEEEKLATKFILELAKAV